MTQPVTTFEADGRKHQISVNDEGQFVAVVDSEPYSADTLDKLKKKLVNLGRRKAARISVPVTMFSKGGRSYYDRKDLSKASFQDLIVVGIHQRNGNMLLRSADGKTADEDSYNSIVFKRLAPAQQTLYLSLRKAEADAEMARETFETTYKIDTKQIKQLVADAEAKAGVEPEQDS